MGGDNNQVLLITRDAAQTWPRMAKDSVARKLAEEIAKALGGKGAART